jgi:hypothetical protein
LRHTIRVREGNVWVRLSDLSKNAPLDVHQSLAYILVSKLLRRRIPKIHTETYRRFAVEVSEQANETRRERGRKIVTSARGRVYDLEKIFSELNQTYFQNKLAAPVLSWSQKKTRRTFGHHDALHDTIIISRTLDDARIPRFVAEFVLYHELLHVVHPVRIINGKRLVHSTTFRRDELKFPHYQEAENWLQKIARQSTKRKLPKRNGS